MKRAHTPENVAPAIVVLRSQFNDEYPYRDKSSDGIWPSAAHSKANPRSDHEAGNAIDIDDDLSRTQSVTPAMAKRLSADKRCKYAIHDGVIYKNGHGRTYHGSNKHEGHLHISVYESRRRDNSPWELVPERVVHIVKTIGARRNPWWASRIKFALRNGQAVTVLGVASNGWLFVTTPSGNNGWIPPYVVK